MTKGDRKLLRVYCDEERSTAYFEQCTTDKNQQFAPFGLSELFTFLGEGLSSVLLGMLSGGWLGAPYDILKKPSVQLVCTLCVEGKAVKKVLVPIPSAEGYREIGVQVEDFQAALSEVQRRRPR